MKKGAAVRVMSGDQKKFLGYGRYLGDVTVFFIEHKDGTLTSLKDAEKPPPKEMIKKGDTLVVMEKNPKIKLDSGEVVYGCQVWWSEDRM